MNETNGARTTCCIAGGGPAGIMLGVLLARAGVQVTVLEKHADFFRDFRGDTIHPSTMQVLDELSWLDDFLKLPHSEVRGLSAELYGESVTLAEFAHVPARCPFIAFMPQWDFLDFLAEKGRAFRTFTLRMNADAYDVLDEGGVIRGVRVRTVSGEEEEIRADLTIAADGRHSTLRQRAGLRVRDLGAPIDVLWMRVSREPTDAAANVLARLEAGGILVMIDRTTYWQCAFVIAKGSFETLRSRPIATLQESVRRLAPFLNERVGEIASWDDVRLLTVRVDRLDRWYRKGLLCIGDAAHAMSPVGGVGINLAIQDAVAAANLLARPLLMKRVTLTDLRAVQRRRLFPTKVTQALQVLIQQRVLSQALSARGGPRKGAHFLAGLFRTVPLLRRLPAYIVGIGIRPEHVRLQTSAQKRG